MFEPKQGVIAPPAAKGATPPKPPEEEKLVLKFGKPKKQSRHRRTVRFEFSVPNLGRRFQKSQSGQAGFHSKGSSARAEGRTAEGAVVAADQILSKEYSGWHYRVSRGRWALVLGASSGFGEAICLKLAEEGMNIAGVHLDRKSTLPHVEEIQGKIKAFGVQSLFFNANAADRDKRGEVVAAIAKQADSIHCLVHSLAFGSLKPFITPEEKDRISPEQMEMDPRRHGQQPRVLDPGPFFRNSF